MLAQAKDQAKTKAKVKATDLGLSENVEAMLAYLLGWITGLVFLLLEKNKFVRWHAAQSLVAFGLLTVVSIVVSTIPFIGKALAILVLLFSFGLWLFCLIKSYQGQKFELPVASEIASKLLASISA
jgi:uncharacterized membrane protein